MADLSSASVCISLVYAGAPAHRQVDLTPSLVNMAKKRVAGHGWDDGLVNVICGDATDPKLPGLPKAGTVDVVTFSYSMTMIPNWEDAIDNALRLLKKGGRLCVCDFTVDSATQNPLMKAIFTKAFKVRAVLSRKASLFPSASSEWPSANSIAHHTHFIRRSLGRVTTSTCGSSTLPRCAPRPRRSSMSWPTATSPTCRAASAVLSITT